MAKASPTTPPCKGMHERYVGADTELARFAITSLKKRALLRASVESDRLVLDDFFLARRISAAPAELLEVGHHRALAPRSGKPPDIPKLLAVLNRHGVTVTA